MRKIPKTFTLSHAAIDNLKNRAVEEQRKPSDCLNLLLEGLTQSVKAKTQSKPKRFMAPLKDDVLTYMVEVGLDWGQAGIESDKFTAYYDSNGWKVGKNKMKCWKSAAKGWIKRNEQKANATTSGQPSKQSKAERVASRIDNLFD